MYSWWLYLPCPIGSSAGQPCPLVFHPLDKPCPLVFCPPDVMHFIMSVFTFPDKFISGCVSQVTTLADFWQTFVHSEHLREILSISLALISWAFSARLRSSNSCFCFLSSSFFNFFSSRCCLYSFFSFSFSAFSASLTVKCSMRSSPVNNFPFS